MVCIKIIRYLSIFFVSIAIKSPQNIQLLEIDSLFRAVFEGFLQNLQKTPSKKGIFVACLDFSGVHFLWAYKENERNSNRKTHGLKTSTVK